MSEITAEQLAETTDQVIARLAALAPLKYEQCRKMEAEKLGIDRVAVLDAEVKKRRGDGESGAKGRAIELYEPEPWPEPVDGAEVLTKASNAIQRHMVIRREDADACALWALHTHIYDAFSHTARLVSDAPEQECGKTLLMAHMVGNMVPRPQSIELMKPAPFFRLAEANKPTFLIDEVDVFIKEDSDLLAAINSGWEPHGGVSRCVGDDHEVRVFSTHCPVAMAGIELTKKLPPTTISRSIVINLERAAIDEIADEDIYDARKHKKALQDIGRMMARWCRDNKIKVKNVDPVLPDKVRNRLADKWRPLFAIAQIAGGDWPDRVKRAMFAQVDMSDPSKAQILLSDIRDIMSPTDAVIATNSLISRLCNLEDSPWRDYNFKKFESRRITSRQLAGLLRRYKIIPSTVRIGIETMKGYRRKNLESAWARYLAPAHPPEISVTASQSSNSKGYSDSVSVTPGHNVTDQKPQKPSNGAGCDIVTDKKGGTSHAGVTAREIGLQRLSEIAEKLKYSASDLTSYFREDLKEIANMPQAQLDQMISDYVT